MIQYIELLGNRSFLYETDEPLVGQKFHDMSPLSLQLDPKKTFMIVMHQDPKIGAVYYDILRADKDAFGMSGTLEVSPFLVQCAFKVDEKSEIGIKYLKAVHGEKSMIEHLEDAPAFTLQK